MGISGFILSAFLGFTCKDFWRGILAEMRCIKVKRDALFSIKLASSSCPSIISFFVVELVVELVVVVELVASYYYQ